MGFKGCDSQWHIETDTFPHGGVKDLDLSNIQWYFKQRKPVHGSEWL